MIGGIKMAAEPWSISRLGSTPGVVCGGVMRQYARGEKQDQLFTIHPCAPDNGGDEAQEAHAMLVVAAPALLRGLVSAREMLVLEGYSEDGPTITEIDAALTAAGW